jgi:RND family efflux transporter MFP subunit
LVAPEPGIIDWRNVEVGEIVAPGQPVFRILGSSRGAVVRVELCDRDALALALGQTARAFIDARPREELSAHVSRIAMSASIGTGMLSVEVKLDNPPRRLPSGVTAKVELNTALNVAASVPVSALVDGDAVFALEGDRVRRVPVQVEFLSDDSAALSGDLGQLQKVVEFGAAPLADGDRVQVVE